MIRGKSLATSMRALAFCTITEARLKIINDYIPTHLATPNKWHATMTNEKTKMSRVVTSPIFSFIFAVQFHIFPPKVRRLRTVNFAFSHVRCQTAGNCARFSLDSDVVNECLSPPECLPG